MANVDAPRGLQPIGKSGGPYTGQTVRCFIPASDGTATFVGDLVTLAGSASSDGYPTVQQGAASDTSFYGVVVGFDAEPTNLELKYRTASTARYCQVVPATPDQEFVVQADGVVVAGDIGNNADIVVGSGDTSTGLSGMELDHSNVGTGVNLHIVRLHVVEGNDFGQDADLVVRVNENVFTDLTPGA